MKTGLLTSSSFFGKYIPNQTLPYQESDRIYSINLKQNFTHQRPFINCKFDIPGNRLYLLDTHGILIHLNLNDNSFSTLKGQKIQNYTIDGNNSLSILYITQKSELFRVSFENKKPVKITNLNMNKIISFQRNYLREMILSLDYKLLFLCDVHKTGPLKVKSLKAKGDQVFTNACFSSNNRFIILAVKNVVIRIMEIMDLKTVHEIRLPFAVQNLKIQVSYNSKHIAIYGDCNIIFFINTLDNGTYTYELIDIPFVKSVSQLRYTCQNDIIFLGNDQVLYGISPDQLDKAVPLFNEQYQMRTMAFDISLDCSKIAIVSNRTVMNLKLPRGLHYQIEQKSTFKQMEYRKNGFDTKKQFGEPIIQDSQQQIEEGELEQNKIQYQDEDEQQQDTQQKQTQPIIKVEDISKLQSSTYKQQCGSLHSVVADMKGVSSEIKAQINSILNNLLENNRDIVGNKPHMIVRALYKLIKDEKIHPQKCFTIMDFVVESLEKQKERLKEYGAVFCPEITAIFRRKFSINFVDFLEEEILNLYSNYFKGSQWKEAINWILSAGVNEKSQNFPMLLICILQEIAQRISKGPQNEKQLELFLDPAPLTIKFSDVYNRMIKIYLDDKYKNLFFKRKVSDYVNHPKNQANNPQNDGNNRLEELISKQEEIKKALSNLKRNKGAR